MIQQTMGHKSLRCEARAHPRAGERIVGDRCIHNQLPVEFSFRLVDDDRCSADTLVCVPFGAPVEEGVANRETKELAFREADTELRRRLQNPCRLSAMHIAARTGATQKQRATEKIHTRVMNAPWQTLQSLGSEATLGCEQHTD